MPSSPTTSAPETATTAGREALPLAELLAEVLGEAGARYRVREEWASRTARFARCETGGDGRRDLVIKVCARWTADRPAATLGNAERLAALDDPGGRWRTLRFVACSAEPPAVVSEAVDGEELKALLRGADRGDVARLRRLSEAAGELLGRIHAELPVAPASRGAGGGRRPVSCAGDFGVYNFRVEAGDRLVYMEPPDRERAVAPGRDVAAFLWSLDSWTPPPLRRAARLARSFVDGYRRGLGEGGAWTPVDALGLRLMLLRRRWRLLRRRLRGEPAAR